MVRRALSAFAISCLLGAAFSDLGGATGASPSLEIFGTTNAPPLTGFFLHARRLGRGDTLELRASASIDAPLATGYWEIDLPADMAFLQGSRRKAGSVAEIKGDYRILVRCLRWGDFVISCHVEAAKDTATWSSLDYQELMHVTVDGIDGPRRVGPIRRRVVVDGVHHRWHGGWWLPLDPGEEEEVEPGFDSSASFLSASAVHAEPAARASAPASDSTLEVPVFVAVDRSGRVKAVQPFNPNPERGVPLSTKAAALAAAWKWRFSPAQSLGRPVSTIYLIKVPVAAAGGQ